MLKKLAILILGVLAGVAMMYFSRLGEKSSDSASEKAEQQEVVVPEFDFSPLYDQLMEEKRGKPDEKYWFDQRIDGLSEEAKKRINRQQSEGDDAAELFKQFSEPENQD